MVLHFLVELFEDSIDHNSWIIHDLQSEFCVLLIFDDTVKPSLDKVTFWFRVHWQWNLSLCWSRTCVRPLSSRKWDSLPKKGRRTYSSGKESLCPCWNYELILARQTCNQHSRVLQYLCSILLQRYFLLSFLFQTLSRVLQHHFVHLQFLLDFQFLTIKLFYLSIILFKLKRRHVCHLVKLTYFILHQLNLLNQKFILLYFFVSNILFWTALNYKQFLTTFPVTNSTLIFRNIKINNYI